MSTTNRPTAPNGTGAGEKSYFEQQRDILVDEIAQASNLPTVTTTCLTARTEPRARPAEPEQAEPELGASDCGMPIPYAPGEAGSGG